MTVSMFRMGVAFRRSSRFEPLRSWLLGAAVVMFVMAVSALTITVATYSVGDERGDARSGRYSDLFPDEEPALLWNLASDVVNGNANVMVVYLQPLVDDPPLPPGIEHLPGAGEVFLSPALMGDFGVHVGDNSRYGKVIGTIDQVGLVDAGERFAYIGTADLTLSRAEAITGFGADQFARTGTLLYRQPLVVLLSIETFLLVAPSFWLLASSLRIGSTLRARRVHMVRLLGARKRDVRTLLLGESALPGIIGATVATVLLGCVFLFDITIPGVAFTVLAGDVRASAVLVVGIALATFVLVALLCASPIGLRRERKRPPSRARLRHIRSPGFLSLILAALTVIGDNIIIGSGNTDLMPLVLLVGAILTVAAIPFDAVTWVQKLSTRVRARAWNRGDPAALTAAGQLGAAPRPAARFAATAAILVVTLTVLLTVITQIGNEALAAKNVQRELGNSIAVVSLRETDDNSWSRAMTGLSDDYIVAGVMISDTGKTTITAGSAADLAALDLSISMDYAPQWLSYLYDKTPIVKVGPIESGTQQLILVRSDIKPIDIEKLRDYLGHTTTPMWAADYPGGNWLQGSEIQAHQSRWLTFFGVIGIGICVLTLWSNYTNELLRAIRSLLPIQVQTPSTSYLKKVMAWRIFPPIGIAIAFSALISLLLSSPAQLLDNSNGQYAIVAASSVIMALTSTIAWHVAWRACRKATRSAVFGNLQE